MYIKWKTNIEDIKMYTWDIYNNFSSNLMREVIKNRIDEFFPNSTNIHKFIVPKNRSKENFSLSFSFKDWLWKINR